MDKSYNGQILEWTDPRRTNPQNGSEKNLIISKCIRNNGYSSQFISWVRLVRLG